MSDTPIEQLERFVEWERKHNPGHVHIAEWALAQVKHLQSELATERRRADDLMEVIRAVSKGVQPCDYGNPDAAIRRFQAMIDGAMKNG